MAAQPDAPLQLPPLPADVLVEIFSRVGDAVSVVRCAATCKAWRRLIQDPSFPSLLRRRAALLGFFFQDTSHRSPRRHIYHRRPTRFLLLLGPSPSQSQLHLSRFLPTAADLARFAPVASSGGLVALRRPPASSHDPVRICVCDPVAGTSTFLPPLPDPESIVFLEASASSFRLLAVKRSPQGEGLLLRVFSSQTGEWGTAVIAERPDNMVIHLNSPAAVHRGAVHWICGTYALPTALHVLAVRFSQSAAAVRRIALPPSAGGHPLRDACKTLRLANSAEGSLSLVLLDELVLSIWKFEDNTARWAHHKVICLVSLFPSTTIGPFPKRGLSIEALCEKSGSLFLHAVGEGLFVINLETERLTRVCKDHSGKYLCPYVPDMSSCIANMIKF